MREIKQKHLLSAEELVRYINKHSIKKEDIQSTIVVGHNWYLIYWEKEKLTNITDEDKWHTDHSNSSECQS